MRPTLIALITILVPTMIAGWLGWVLLEDRGMSLVFAMITGVTFVPPFARLAQAAGSTSARTQR